MKNQRKVVRLQAINKADPKNTQAKKHFRQVESMGGTVTNNPLLSPNGTYTEEVYFRELNQKSKKTKSEAQSNEDRTVAYLNPNLISDRAPMIDPFEASMLKVVRGLDADKYIETNESAASFIEDASRDMDSVTQSMDTFLSYMTREYDLIPIQVKRHYVSPDKPISALIRIDETHKYDVTLATKPSKQGLSVHISFTIDFKKAQLYLTDKSFEIKSIPKESFFKLGPAFEPVFSEPVLKPLLDACLKGTSIHNGNECILDTFDSVNKLEYVAVALPERMLVINVEDDAESKCGVYAYGNKPTIRKAQNAEELQEETNQLHPTDDITFSEWLDIVDRINAMWESVTDESKSVLNTFIQLVTSYPLAIDTETIALDVRDTQDHIVVDQVTFATSDYPMGTGIDFHYVEIDEETEDSIDVYDGDTLRHFKQGFAMDDGRSPIDWGMTWTIQQDPTKTSYQPNDMTIRITREGAEPQGYKDEVLSGHITPVSHPLEITNVNRRIYSISDPTALYRLISQAEKLLWLMTHKGICELPASTWRNIHEENMGAHYKINNENIRENKLITQAEKVIHLMNDENVGGLSETSWGNHHKGKNNVASGCQLKNTFLYTDKEPKDGEMITVSLGNIKDIVEFINLIVKHAITEHGSSVDEYDVVAWVRSEEDSPPTKIQKVTHLDENDNPVVEEYDESFEPIEKPSISVEMGASDEELDENGMTLLESMAMEFVGEVMDNNYDSETIITELYDTIDAYKEKNDGVFRREDGRKLSRYLSEYGLNDYIIPILLTDDGYVEPFILTAYYTETSEVTVGELLTLINEQFQVGITQMDLMQVLAKIANEEEDGVMVRDVLIAIGEDATVEQLDAMFEELRDYLRMLVEEKSNMSLSDEVDLNLLKQTHNSKDFDYDEKSDSTVEIEMVDDTLIVDATNDPNKLQ